MIDLAQNSASLKISPQIYLRILGKALEQTEKDLLDIEKALAVPDFTTVQSIAHRLKGDYANMRVTELSQAAKQMNDVAKTTQDKQQISSALQQFKSYFAGLQNYLKKVSVP